jgi:hypothetical protein
LGGLPFAVGLADCDRVGEVGGCAHAVCTFSPRFGKPHGVRSGVADCDRVGEVGGLHNGVLECVLLGGLPFAVGLTKSDRVRLADVQRLDITPVLGKPHGISTYSAVHIPEPIRGRLGGC